MKVRLVAAQGEVAARLLWRRPTPFGRKAFGRMTDSAHRLAK